MSTPLPPYFAGLVNTPPIRRPKMLALGLHSFSQLAAGYCFWYNLSSPISGSDVGYKPLRFPTVRPGGLVAGLPLGLLGGQLHLSCPSAAHNS